MVQIRRERAKRSLVPLSAAAAAAATTGSGLLHHRNKKNHRTTTACWQTVAVSALVPVLFGLRAWFSAGSSPGHSTSLLRDGVKTKKKKVNPYVEYLNRLDLGGSNSHDDQLQHHQLPGYLVELDYCDTKGVDFTKFVELVEGPLLNYTLAELQKQQHPHAIPQDDVYDHEYLVSGAAHEFLLQLLEQHLQMEGRCDYSRYRPTVPALMTTASNGPIDELPKWSNSNNNCPVVAVISAFRDVEQLAALLRALLLDGDDDDRICAVVHLDARCDEGYRAAVERVAEELLDRSTVVVILQFGSVVYRTDALSLVNLRILRWLTTGGENSHGGVDYQYVVLLDGSAFPLVSARTLVDTLLSSSGRRDVWLGGLTHNGRDAAGTAWDFRLERKRLVDTRHKLHKRLPRDAWGGGKNAAIPPHIRQHLVYKTTSGNQAIYSRRVVQQLLSSDSVMELFALAKYGCCCCIEEHSWAAALSMIGHAPEAALRQPPMMFQAWGGEGPDCVGSMHNAVLSTNASLCFRSEDPHSSNYNNGNNATTTAATAEQRLYYRGDQTWDKLVDARRRGFLFARKFRSDRADSVQLRHDIQSKLWGLEY